MKRWYAARVITGKEYDIRKELRNLNIDCEVYIPRQLITEYKKGKIEQRTEKMLPGYLLIGSSSPLNAFLKADFLKIIGEVTPEEIKRLKALEIDEDGTIQVGSKIIIVDGAFAGCKGKVLKRDIENRTARCRLVFQGMDLEMEMRQDYINTIK